LGVTTHLMKNDKLMSLYPCMVKKKILKLEKSKRTQLDSQAEGKVKGKTSLKMKKHRNILIKQFDNNSKLLFYKK